ncbi:MAG: LysR family transcriptional regulator [Heliobacteriaceae bacterium]|nr:LysR family transcriptional regulator [Heliobacteriaceae bacterium]
MNFRQLETFLVIAEELSFTRAAKLLGMTQPAVSMQIKALEEDLGVLVFERHERNVSLSPAGKVLQVEAAKVVESTRQMRVALAEFLDLKRGSLKIGASTLPGEYLIAPVIGRFQARYPGIKVEMVLGNTETILQQVLERELDLGLVGALPDINLEQAAGLLPGGPAGLVPVAGVNLEVKVWCLDQLVFLVPGDHRLVAKGKAAIAEVITEKWLWREAGSGTRQVIEAAFTQAGMRPPPNRITELTSTRAIITAVAAGLGVSFVSGFAAEESLLLKRVVALPLEDLTITRPIYAIRLNKRVDHPPENAYWSFLGEYR